MPATVAISADKSRLSRARNDKPALCDIEDVFKNYFKFQSAAVIIVKYM